jgi:hypothetical protein
MLLIFASWANGQPKFGAVIPAGVFYEASAEGCYFRQARERRNPRRERKRSALPDCYSKGCVTHG